MVSMFHACNPELEFHLALRSCEAQPGHVRPVLRISLCGSGMCDGNRFFRERENENNSRTTIAACLIYRIWEFWLWKWWEPGQEDQSLPGCSLRALLVHCALSSCPRARQCRDPVKPQPLNSAVIREAFWINSPVKGIPLKCLFVWKKNPFIIGEWQSRGSDTVAEGYLDVWAPLTPARKMKSQRDDGSAASI